MRRQKRESEKEHTITYNLTKAQLDQMVNSLVQKQISEAKREAADEAINTALALFLGLPLCVLMDEYWKKSYAQKLPGFTDKVIEYYEAWQDGKLSLDEIKLRCHGQLKLLLIFGGVFENGNSKKMRHVWKVL